MLAACGDNLAGPDARGRDAAVFVPGPNLVTIDVTEDTTDVMYRNDGKGPWGLADKISATEYQIHVTDAYEVIIACGQEWRGETELHGRTFADGDRDFLFCLLPPTTARLPVATITGQMQQPGVVTLGNDVQESAIGPWNYALSAYPGTYDLLALDNSYRIAIRRDQSITGDTTLPSLDLSSEGTPVIERSFSVFAPETGETIDISTLLFTATTLLGISGTDHSIREVPPSLLVGSDEQFLDVYADAAETRRGAFGPIGARNDVELMPLLSRSAFVYSVPDNNALRADFKTLPAFTSLRISLYDVRSAQHAEYTKAWFETMGRSYFQLDVPPEFDPTWRVSLRPEYYRFTYVDDDAVDLSRYTSRVDDVTNVLGN